MAKRNKFGMNDGCVCKVGGAALMEGVMMKSEDAVAMAVRTSDGSIKIIKRPAKSGTKRKIAKIPFIRGAFNLFESMFDSIYYLTKSAEFVDLEVEEEKDAEPSRFDKFMEKVFKDKLMDVMMAISVIISLAFSIGLFMLLPKVIVELFGMNDVVIVKNIIEGAIRIFLFIGYIFLASRLKDIKRVFSYHGAEHKTIHCLEHGEELTVENVRKYTTLHPRCGTAFMFLIMVISILLFSFIDLILNAIGWTSPVVKVFARLLFMPLLAGITYEVTRLATRSKSKFVRAINAPGLAMQRLTTIEPDDSMIEVGIASLIAATDASVPFTTEEEMELMIKESQGAAKRKQKEEAASESKEDKKAV